MGARTVKPWEKYATPAAAGAPTGPWARYQGDSAPAYEAEGAPVGVRAAVGTARPQDRLATLQRYFPDAQPHGDDNFVYTDPATSKRTLYNERGLIPSLGDVASLGREAAEVGGSLVGGMAGAPGGIPGMIAGAAAGQAAGGKLLDIGRSAAGMPQSYSAADTVGDAAWGAAGELGGQALSRVGRAGARLIARPGSQDTLTAAERAGVPVTASGIGTKHVAGMDQMSTGALPSSAGSRAHAAQARQVGELLEQARPQTAGNPQTVQEAAQQAGGVLKTSADRAYAAFKAERETADKQFYQALPNGLRLRLPDFRRTATALRTEIAGQPGTSGAELAPALAAVERIEADLAANRGSLTPEMVRRAKTALFETIEATTDITPGSGLAMRSIYRSLDNDIQSVARTTSPQALGLYQRHNRLVRAFRGGDLGREAAAGSIDSILKAKSDEAAYSALTSTRGGFSRMQRLVDNMAPDERAVVARASWDRMATTPAGNPKSPAAWASEWLSVPRAKKDLLFQGITDVDQMDALARVMRAEAAGAAGRNTSNTAYTQVRGGILGALGLAIADVATGATGGAGALALKTAIGPYALSEAIYFPGVIPRIVGAAARTGPPGGASRAMGQTAAQAIEQMESRPRAADLKRSAFDLLTKLPDQPLMSELNAGTGGALRIR